MPHPTRRNVAEQVSIQLIEADVDIGFALVDEAKAYRTAGQHEFSTRALQDATEILADIDRRLQRLGDSECGPFLPLVAELRKEIRGGGTETP